MPLECLPEEVLLMIARLLPSATRSALARTCRALSGAANSALYDPGGRSEAISYALRIVDDSPSLLIIDDSPSPVESCITILEAVRRFAQEGEFDNPHDWIGFRTPLQKAAESGIGRVAKCLIDLGANPNYYKYHPRPLALVLRSPGYRYEATIRVLICAGALLECCSSAAHLAVDYNLPEYFETFDNLPQIHLKDHPAIAERLRLNAVGELSILEYACAMGRQAVIFVLLNKTKPVGCALEFAIQALIRDSTWPFHILLPALLRHGADLNGTILGKSILQRLAEAERYDLMRKKLLRYIIKYNPLQRCHQGRMIQATGLLLQLGVTVDKATQHDALSAFRILRLPRQTSTHVRTTNLLDRKQNDKRVWAEQVCLAILRNGDAKRDDIDRFCKEIDIIASAWLKLPDIETDDVSGVRRSLRLIKEARDDIR